jgi:hypothetical protein
MTTSRIDLQNALRRNKSAAFRGHSDAISSRLSRELLTQSRPTAVQRKHLPAACWDDVETEPLLEVWRISRSTLATATRGVLPLVVSRSRTTGHAVVSPDTGIIQQSKMLEEQASSLH